MLYLISFKAVSLWLVCLRVCYLLLYAWNLQQCEDFIPLLLRLMLYLISFKAISLWLVCLRVCYLLLCGLESAAMRRFYPFLLANQEIYLHFFLFSGRYLQPR
jgi:hypothetical protein